ncbi:MAG: histidine triad nucleotide-binding protein [Syntrophus sp. RIFOXYC2_FULL_54_9]|nr:MAG: histidine triad nucleotide-binding protein [Syntrophus sp. GWC2_56_31]OHE26721.1 MAG: histidine triad nucleotide-binding protein [Syntrophus sp. RIFOXYC2_FULL_54_9]HBB15783.1 histidine triad nucleotide-binding protein [Syntrophus sp. (in: bacteria)]
MEDCIFCKIAAGEIPCRKVYENEKVLAFEDIHPMAPIHVIIIPKRHIATLMDVDAEGMADLQSMMSAAQEVARVEKVDQKGFRMVINCNKEGGQVVFHLHMHLLGGLRLKNGLA